MTDYKPGTCNINETERKKRLIVGIVGFFNAALLSATMLIYPGFTPLYFTIFLLYLTGFVGYLQYRNHFCTGYALKKKFKTNKSEEEIENSESISKDRRKAALIILQSIIGAGLLTLIIYLIAANI
ncbi:hypothetical protein [Candidatus Nanohalobium constans]|uniref:Uncharacterized protein n=1 Tax=Candidatus Nanohalobium constans TaxID=2565781 RepID=A0A5Q0UGS7_9ARCH|nr:hypothetical protein [Candidatus Nanohalobium constans]QGA80410.1 hypothetical protein LC1Nh_0510 [Candidatus Nanohalobium constans]